MALDNLIYDRTIDNVQTIKDLSKMIDLGMFLEGHIDEEKTYFGCHTDVTIPFDELEVIEVITKDEEIIPIIKNGRFVLKGTEELNDAF